MTFGQTSMTKRVCYLALLGFVGAHIASLSLSIDSPPDSIFFWFLLFGISPFFYCLILVRLISSQLAEWVSLILILAIGFVGTFLLVDSLFLNPEAQSAIAVIIVPAVQWAMVLLASVPIYLTDKRQRKADH